MKYTTASSPIQQYFKKNHSRQKKRLIGLGGNKTSGFPNAEKPNFNRSKSAPPGFGALQEEKNTSNKASVIFLLNSENEILLLKRKADDDWGANQWAAIGGGIEENEDPYDAIIRETFEETRINLTKSNLKYEDLKNDHVHFFSCKLNHIPEPVINFEHQDWMWCPMNKLKKLDCVPEMLENVEEFFNIKLF